MASASPLPDPLAALSPSQHALLRLLCWVAWADGDLAEPERELLTRLAARLLPAVDPAAAVSALVAEPAADLEPLVAQLANHDERLLLVKLAVQMACSSGGPHDEGPINPAERAAYRRLLDALQLPQAEVEAAEWAGRQALADTPSLLDRLNQLLFGWGAWPSVEALELQGTQWL